MPNLALVMPFVILFLFSLWQVRSKKFSWFFVIFVAVVIVLIRIYEAQLVYWLHQQLS